MSDNSPEGPQYSDNRDPQSLGQIFEDFTPGPPSAEDEARRAAVIEHDAVFRRDSLLDERQTVIEAIQNGDKSLETLTVLTGLNQELQQVENQLNELHGGPQDIVPE